MLVPYEVLVRYIRTHATSKNILSRYHTDWPSGSLAWLYMLLDERVYSRYSTAVRPGYMYVE